MRIVMIGHSNVGKTTYMASMYGAMQKGVKGFTLQAAVPDDHARFLKLHAAVRANRYPAPTDQRSQYDFRLCHNGSAVFDFTWVDRRGGAILERSSSWEAGQLVRDLVECDGLLVFCDAAAAVRGDEEANEMERISQLVGKAMADRYKPMPLGLVLTKSDLVLPTDARAEAPLRPLIEAASKNRKLQRATARVACGSAERNVAAPVLFALRHGIRNSAVELDQEFTRWNSLAATEEAKSRAWGGWDVIFKVIGERTWAEEAVISRRIAAGKRAEWQPLDAAAGQLDAYLRTAVQY